MSSPASLKSPVFLSRCRCGEQGSVVGAVQCALSLYAACSVQLSPLPTHPKFDPGHYFLRTATLYKVPTLLLTQSLSPATQTTVSV